MNIYLLTPINEDEPDWALSAVRCAIQVRALDEPQARHAASDQLCPSHLFRAGLTRPWSRIDRAVATSVKQVDVALPLLEASSLTGRPGRPTKQFFYLLKPVNVLAREWDLSLSTSPVCVLARGPRHARALAALHFDIDAKEVPGEELLFHPWWNPKLVSVEQVDEPPADVKTITPKDMPARFGLRIRPKGSTG